MRGVAVSGADFTKSFGRRRALSCFVGSSSGSAILQIAHYSKPPFLPPSLQLKELQLQREQQQLRERQQHEQQILQKSAIPPIIQLNSLPVSNAEIKMGRLLRLRTMLAAACSGAQTIDSLEQIFKLYLQVTLAPSPSSKVYEINELDFATLTNFLLAVAANHLRLENQARPAHTATLTVEDKTSVFKKLFEKCLFANRAKLLFQSFSSIMPVHNLLPANSVNFISDSSDFADFSENQPPAKCIPLLPSIFSSFSRLILGDIVRMKVSPISSSNTIIPILVSLHKLESETDAVQLMTTLLSSNVFSNSNTVLRTDYLVSAVITSFSANGRIDLATAFFESDRQFRLTNEKKSGENMSMKSKSTIMSFDALTSAINVKSNVANDSTREMFPYITIIQALISHNEFTRAARIAMELVLEFELSMALIVRIWKSFLRTISDRYSAAAADAVNEGVESTANKRAKVPQEIAEQNEKDRFITEKTLQLYWKRVEKLDGKLLKELTGGFKGVYVKFWDILIKHYIRINDYAAILQTRKLFEERNIRMSVGTNNRVLHYLFEIGQGLSVGIKLDKIGQRIADTVSAKVFDKITDEIHDTITDKFTVSEIDDKNTEEINIKDFPNGFRHALALFDILISEYPEIKPDSATYSNVIHIFFKLGRKDKAIASYSQMLDQGIRPNVIVCTILMNGLLKVGDLKAAFQVFGAFESSGSDEELLSRIGINEGNTPDTIMHTSLLQKFAEMNDDSRVKHGYALFSDSDTSGQDVNNKRSYFLKPDLILLNILINYFTRTGQPAYTLATLNDIDRLGLSPDSFTATAIVHGLVQFGDITAAERAASRMVSLGIPVTMHAITALIPRTFSTIGSGKNPETDAVSLVGWIEAILQTQIISKKPAAILELARICKFSEDMVVVRLRNDRNVKLANMWTSPLLTKQFPPDFRFFNAAVRALVRIGAVEAADCVLRFIVHERINSKDEYRDVILRLVDNVVGVAWINEGNEKRAKEIRRIFQVK
ncbi:hypothetical protein HK100_001719 [Physocladia obscura]|uniref:Pentatricopeptide repeat-containing protein n=1 Tax=Physocladia obscura TaxID=109957 RepID=A0AAD5XEP5_9FUNG|nr:hypothetical protein HK100_001719 [Physocladia obscura]